MHIILRMHDAAKKRQKINPSADPNKFEQPVELICLCDDAFAKPAAEDDSSRSALLLLRGTNWNSMADWPAAATDLQAAYVASNGKAPWILGRAAWSTASNTDGLP